MTLKEKRIFSFILAFVMLISGIGIIPTQEAKAIGDFKIINNYYSNLGLNRYIEKNFPNSYDNLILQLYNIQNNRGLDNQKGHSFNNFKNIFSGRFGDEAFTLDGHIAYCLDITTPATGARQIVSDLNSLNSAWMTDQKAINITKAAKALTQNNFALLNEALRNGNILVAGTGFNLTEAKRLATLSDSAAIALKRGLVQLMVYHISHNFTHGTGYINEQGSGYKDKEGNWVAGREVKGYSLNDHIKLTTLYNYGLKAYEDNAEAVAYSYRLQYGKEFQVPDSDYADVKKVLDDKGFLGSEDIEVSQRDGKIYLTSYLRKEICFPIQKTDQRENSFSMSFPYKSGTKIGSADGSGQVIASTGQLRTIAVEICTDYKQGSLTLNKLDKDTGKAIGIAKFQLLDHEGKLVKLALNGDFRYKADIKGNREYFYTDKNGTTTISDLPLLEEGQSYKVKEIDAPSGYQLKSNQTEVIITQNTPNRTLNLLNEKTRLKITKIDANTKNPVSGAQFALYNANDERINFSLVGSYRYEYKQEGNRDSLWVDKNGVTEISKLPLGDYKLVELKSPIGYMVNTKATKFNLSQTKADQELVVENQRIPQVKTSAADKRTEKKQINPTKTIEVVDHVHYQDLFVGKEYEIKGILMDKETGQAYLDQDGNNVTSKLVFTPSQTNGIVDLVFSLEGDDVRGKTLVVFEELYQDGQIVAIHADINDKEQTLKVKDPGIKTYFTGLNGEKIFLPKSTITLYDRLQYEGLIPGLPYEAHLVVMDKETNSPLLNEKGNSYETKLSFTPTKESGEVQLSIDILADALSGKQLVAFEEIYYEGNLIAQHKDITDEGQTVEISNPKIRTRLEDINGLKELHQLKEVSLVDHVSYSGLIAGEEYALELVLMDKETGQALLDKDGQTVTATKTFLAEKREGIETVEIKVDLSNHLGKQIVAFESLSHDGVEIVAHKDINDKAQTIDVSKISIKTLAKSQGSKIVKAQEKAEITDTISYSGLIVGKQYTIKGVLMDKSTGLEFVDANGKKVYDDITFLAESPEGSTELVFNFNASDLYDKDLVVFEDLYHDGQLLASHRDLNDEAQTVTIETKPTFKPVKENPRTGDVSLLPYLLMLMTAITLFIFFKHQKLESIAKKNKL